MLYPFDSEKPRGDEPINMYVYVKHLLDPEWLTNLPLFQGVQLDERELKVQVVFLVSLELVSLDP